MIHRALLFCLLGLGLTACGHDHDAHLAVRGSATVDLDGTESGFEFADDMLLEDDRIGRYDRIAGHCAIDRGAAGEPDVVSLSLSRPDGSTSGGEGVRSLVFRLEGESTKVTAMMGDTEFSADGGAACTVTELYRDDHERIFGLESDCAVSDDAGRTAQVVADLHYAGCDVQ
jgi:hypothetical protein